MYQISSSTGYTARIWVSSSTGIRYITKSGIIRYPVSGRILIPVLSGNIIIGFIYLILGHLKCGDHSRKVVQMLPL